MVELVPFDLDVRIGLLEGVDQVLERLLRRRVRRIRIDDELARQRLRCQECGDGRAGKHGSQTKFHEFLPGLVSGDQGTSPRRKTSIRCSRRNSSLMNSIKWNTI
jgi:hypothetical protein